MELIDHHFFLTLLLRVSVKFECLSRTMTATTLDLSEVIVVSLYSREFIVLVIISTEWRGCDRGVAHSLVHSPAQGLNLTLL
jgi:hypothetical protein